MRFLAQQRAQGRKAYDELIARFNEEYPDITIKHEIVPFDQTQNKFKTAADAGSGAPDILRAEVAWTPEFASLGYLYALDGTEALDNNFLETPLSSNEFDGKTYGVPQVTDTLGLMLRIEVHSASVQDRDGAALVLDRIASRFPFLERIFADGGYQGPRVEAAAPRPVEIIKRTDAGFVVQPKRWVIERTSAGACINRRLAGDVERAAETVKALFHVAMIKLMTRRIARYRDF